MMRPLFSLRTCIALLLSLGTADSAASGPAGAAPEDGRSPRTAERGHGDPHEAYESGAFGEAAQRFAERAEHRPDDPRLQHNLGSALHRLDDYDGAQAAWELALEAGEERELRARTHYNLGNNAYRQGRLEDAVEHYEAALDVDPDDEDAKFNLEFVQRELERRREEAQNRPQQDPSSEDQQQQEQEEGESSNEGEQQDQQGDSGQQPDRGEESSDGGGEDSDGDGLPDSTERTGENPTDPRDPDTDGDGRTDGEEDRNRNGRVDEGESDPNRPDRPPGEQGQGQGADEAPAAPLSMEEAQRLLASLEDSRPTGPREVGEAATKKKSDKDW